MGRRYGVGFGAIRCATIPKPPDTPSGYRGRRYTAGISDTTADCRLPTADCRLNQTFSTNTRTICSSMSVSRTAGEVRAEEGAREISSASVCAAM